MERIGMGSGQVAPPPPGFVLVGGGASAPPSPPPGFVLEGTPNPNGTAQSAGMRFMSGVGRSLNPMNLVNAAGGVAQSQIDALKQGDMAGLIPFAPMGKQMAQASADRLGEAARLAIDEGNLLGAAGQAGAAVPMLGEMGADIGQRAADSGDYAGLAGELAGMAITPKTGATALRGGVRAVKAGVPLAAKVGPEVAAGIVGEAITGGLSGGLAGATAAHLLRPKVAAWLKERFGMSAAKAEATAGKMSEKALADLAERESILEAKQIAAVENKVIKREIADAKKMAKVDSKIRPIPPNKLPPVLPDPVVREIAPAPKPVVAPEAPAVAPAVDEAAARAARQKQHIEDSYKAKAEKDAKNVAAEDNLLFDLERSIEHLKKRGPEKPAPSPAQSIAEKVKERVLSMKGQGMSRGQMKASVLEDILTRKDGYRPADVQRAVDLILKETN